MGKLFLLQRSLNETRSRDQAKFRLWHVEDLLNQAADLADRSLSQRNLLRQLVDRRRELIFQAATLEAEATKTSARRVAQWYAAEAVSIGAASGYYDQVRDALQIALNIANDLVQNDANNPPTETQNYRERQAAFAQCKADIATRDSWKDSLFRDVPVLEAEAAARVEAIRVWLSEVFKETAPPLLERITFLDEQIDASNQAIEADFQDAVNRAAVAQDGLRLIYGSKISELPNAQAVGPLSLLDGVSLWIREAIRWLTAIQQLEQEVTLVLSLKQIIGQTMFDKLVETLKAGQSPNCEFAIGASAVPTHRYIRFRGMRAASVNCAATLRGVLEFPRLAYSAQINDGVESEVEIRQQEVPPCVLGRIDDRAHIRTPDFVAPGALLNVSPFGDTKGNAGRFELTLEPITSLKALEDIHLEFCLAGISKVH